MSGELYGWISIYFGINLCFFMYHICGDGLWVFWNYNLTSVGKIIIFVLFFPVVMLFFIWEFIQAIMFK